MRTTSRQIIASALLLAAAATAGAQVSAGAGGHITTMAAPTGSHVMSYTEPALAFNSDPANPRYFANVYAQGTWVNGGVTWADDPAASGDLRFKAFKATVTRPSGLNGDTLARAEVSPRWDYAIAGVRWYAFSLFFPEDWVENSAEMVVAQLHTSQRAGIVVSPPVGFTVMGKYLRVGVQTSELSDDPAVTPHLEKLTSSAHNIRLATVERGKWYCLVMRADWSSTPGSGVFTLWMNGKVVYQAENAPNSYKTWLGNYAKTGLYVPGITGMPATQTLYTGYVHLGGPDTTHEEMAALMPCAEPQ